MYIRGVMAGLLKISWTDSSVAATYLVVILFLVQICSLPEDENFAWPSQFSAPIGRILTKFLIPARFLTKF